MDTKSSAFQLIVMTVAGMFAVIGLVVFALRGGSFGTTSAGAVTMWGQLDQSSMQAVLSTLRQTDKTLDQVTYVEKDAATYEDDLINAIAAGTPPDLFILPQDDVALFLDKIQLIPYSAMSQSAYTAAYIEEARLYLLPEGLAALPIVVDPLVMYWNRDLFSTAGIAAVPSVWNDVLAAAPRLSQADAAKNLVRSAVAMGLWSNVTNAKELFSTLVMQAGDPIVTNTDGERKAVFGTNPSAAVENPAAAALRFYTDFANPSKSVYSWNRSRPAAHDAFAAGKTAMYFGFAGEYASLRESNPGLNFSVAVIPQVSAQGVSMTYGRLLGLAVPKGATNPTGAVAVAVSLSGLAGDTALSSAFALPSARRDVLQSASQDATSQVFVQSALIARGFIDPSPSATEQIFKSMVESVVSGAQTPSEAALAGSQRFARLFIIR